MEERRMARESLRAMSAQPRMPKRIGSVCDIVVLIKFLRFERVVIIVQWYIRFQFNSYSYLDTWTFAMDTQEVNHYLNFNSFNKKKLS